MSSEIAAIGVDVGNTNYTAALVSGDGQCIEVRQGKTDVAGGPNAMLRGLSVMLPALLEIALIRELVVKGIGVGFGGPVDFYAGLVVLSHQTPGWEGFPLRDCLEEMTGLRVVLDNDANAGGLGEWRFGSGRGARDVVYYNIGTGIGGAVILDGALRRGPGTAAGELGHVTVDPHGPICTCGQPGCLETLASGRAIGRRVVGAAIPWRGRLAVGEDLFPMIEAGVEEARGVLSDVVDALAFAVRSMLHILNPEIVIFGGGVSAGGGDLLLGPLRRRLEEIVFPAAFTLCQFVPARLGYHAGVIGAASLVLP